MNFFFTSGKAKQTKARPNSTAPRPKKIEIKEEYKEEKPSSPKLKLPNDFATKVLDLEILVEDSIDVSIDVINKLLGLYTQAIEYYVSIQSDKYKHFQKKMNNLMVQPQVMESMEIEHQKRTVEEKKKRDIKYSSMNHSGVLSSKGPDDLEPEVPSYYDDEDAYELKKPNFHKVALQRKRKDFEMEMNLNNITKFDKVKEIMKNYQKTNVRNDFIIQTSLNQQLLAIKHKLSLRKKDKIENKISNTSTISSRLDPNNMYLNTEGNKQSILNELNDIGQKSVKSAASNKNKVETPLKKISIKRSGSELELNIASPKEKFKDLKLKITEGNE